MICPGCVAEAKRAHKGSRPGLGTRLSRAAALGRPVVTYSIIAVTLLVYAVQFVTGGFVTNLLLFNPVTLWVDGDRFEPWRALTVTLVHGGIWHVLFNMVTLWLFGRVLEPLYGRLRFGLVWVAAALGGSLAVVIATPTGSVIGASGAVFGLFGAYFVVMRQARMNTTSLLVLVGINVVMGFINPGVSWQAHIGGLLVGLLAGWLVSRDVRGPRAVSTDGRKRPPASGAVLVGVLALALFGACLLWANTIGVSTAVAGG
ncbi:rhomboid family intramembrane serine protease [Pseudoclavibacter endophyticus]|uniref:Rhomboid family intramembrane serine protease n=1 Tax=Pseudoclavibacter endophyticus TaxID=1778590 RepID=A0A6H9WPE2_9MICO|nr:rhomboid family intramembrane serine protease [Pseudoclavibacter endophyticus]